jgi:hypothetical protein
MKTFVNFMDASDRRLAWHCAVSQKLIARVPGALPP